VKLSGKVALITGGARMGESIALTLAQRGCSIALTWRSSRSAADRTVALLTAQGAGAASFRCDLSQDVSVRRMLSQLERRFGRLDILVNLASIYEASPLRRRDHAKVLVAHWKANTESAYRISTAAAALMKRSGAGRMVHIADWTSASGRPRYRDYSGYYVSKAGVKAVVETLALELAPSILVNAIAPGPVLPPKGLTVREERAVRSATPLGRWGGPEEVAKAVLFLLETDFVTGETVRVDGGRHLY
jgi:NAD(P)-dependent dehydrogenase (short-subunit alcohol dehydrogenase family)